MARPFAPSDVDKHKDGIWAQSRTLTALIVCAVVDLGVSLVGHDLVTVVHTGTQSTTPRRKTLGDVVFRPDRASPSSGCPEAKPSPPG